MNWRALFLGGVGVAFILGAGGLFLLAYLVKPLDDRARDDRSAWRAWGTMFLLFGASLINEARKHV